MEKQKVTKPIKLLDSQLNKGVALVLQAFCLLKLNKKQQNKYFLRENTIKKYLFLSLQDGISYYVYEMPSCS
ncbi:MAG: hypothetical protein K8R67_03990 [Desulfobacteraceae bacterium]|nr:hypothetical protein [Desulfobacteraceae bacterium]